MSGWPPGGEAYDVEPVAGLMPAHVILSPVPAPTDVGSDADRAEIPAESVHEIDLSEWPS